MAKPHLCKECGETNPENFYGSNKSICKECDAVRRRQKYVRKPKRTSEQNQVAYGKDTEYFKQTVIANHCDVYLLDRVSYKRNGNEVEIGCKKHLNYFKVQATTLLRRTQRNGGVKKNPVVGSCPICREEYFAGIKTDFINKCRTAHNNEYEYKEFVNQETPLVVICKTHGEFVAKKPYNHSTGGIRCPRCKEEYRNQQRAQRYANISRYQKIIKPINTKPLMKRLEKRQKKIKRLIGAANRVLVKITKSKNNNKYTLETYIEKVREFNGDRYSFKKTVYVNRETDVVVTCTKHGIDISRKAYVFIRNVHGNKPRVSCCPECRKEFNASNTVSRPVPLKQVKPKKPKKQLFVIKADGKYYHCSLHGDVKVGRTRLYKQGCPTCNIEKYQKNYGTDLTVVGKTKYYRCSKHGMVAVGKSRKPYMGCPTCNTEKYQKTFRSYEEAKRRVNSLGINSHAEYRNWKKRTNQVDLPANPERTYKGKGWVDFYEFFDNNRVDNMSNGEKRIYKYLQNKDIDFVCQKKFKKCRNINQLLFDFYLPDYNVCIEFDGQQHFRPANFSSCPDENQRKFEQIQINDSIKTRYCKDAGITLIRLDDYHLNNNIVEWELDVELTRIAAEIAVSEL